VDERNKHEPVTFYQSVIIDQPFDNPDSSLRIPYDAGEHARITTGDGHLPLPS